MMNHKLPIVLSAVVLSIAVLSLMPGANLFAFAESDAKPVVKATEQLRKNPLAMKILAEMEAQKLRYKTQMQMNLQPTLKPTLEQLEVEKQRSIAQERLSERLDAFILKYKDKMPEAAFAKFVEKKPTYIHNVFWGMFDYTQGKVDSGRAAMKQVLDNGGSLQEARDAYFSHASSKRVQLIEVVKELNIQHGFADGAVQDSFDELGKLPRSDA